jgi:hypothetical protein
MQHHELLHVAVHPVRARVAVDAVPPAAMRRWSAKSRLRAVLTVRVAAASVGRVRGMRLALALQYREQSRCWRRCGAPAVGTTRRNRSRPRPLVGVQCARIKVLTHALIVVCVARANASLVHAAASDCAGTRSDRPRAEWTWRSAPPRAPYGRGRRGRRRGAATCATCSAARFRAASTCRRGALARTSRAPGSSSRRRSQTAHYAFRRLYSHAAP